MLEDAEDLPQDATSTNGVLEKKEPTPVGEAAVLTIHELREKFICLACKLIVNCHSDNGLTFISSTS